MSKIYDVVIIGAGPGGYNCAIRAGQLGLSVACIEKRDTLGGTCLNVGCIPSKSLLHSSELFHTANTEFAKLGIDVGTPKLNLGQMMKAKGDAVAGLTKGVAFLLKKNKVEVIHGHGTFVDGKTVRVTGVDGKSQTLTAKNIVVATGSEPASLPGITIDEDRIVSSTGALEFAEVPEKLVVIGAGVIGLELGSVWARLGAQVTVLEYAEGILPGADREIAKAAQAIYEKQGLSFVTGAQVTGAEANDASVDVTFKMKGEEETQGLLADRVIVAVGRRPYTDGLAIEKAGLNTDARGVLVGDKSLKLGENIWAIGDCTSGPMLAHKAEDEGVAVAEMIANQTPLLEHDLIPSVVYTTPEVAWVGKSEEDLSGADIRVGRFPFMANSRARASGEGDGLVKVIADAKTDQVLGVHIVGIGAGELIGEACTLMAMSGSAEDLARICHAHPTRSEALRQSAMDVAGWAMQK